MRYNLLLLMLNSLAFFGIKCYENSINCFRSIRVDEREYHVSQLNYVTMEFYLYFILLVNVTCNVSYAFMVIMLDYSGHCRIFKFCSMNG